MAVPGPYDLVVWCPLWVHSAHPEGQRQVRSGTPLVTAVSAEAPESGTAQTAPFCWCSLPRRPAASVPRAAVCLPSDMTAGFLAASTCVLRALGTCQCDLSRARPPLTPTASITQAGTASRHRGGVVGAGQRASGRTTAWSGLSNQGAHLSRHSDLGLPLVFKQRLSLRSHPTHTPTPSLTPSVTPSQPFLSRCQPGCSATQASPEAAPVGFWASGQGPHWGPFGV